MKTIEKLEKLYDRDFPAEANEQNNPEYKKFIEDMLLVFPKLLAAIEAGDALAAACDEFVRGVHGLGRRKLEEILMSYQKIRSELERTE